MTTAPRRKASRRWLGLLALATIIAAGALLARALGVDDLVRLDRLASLRDQITGLGAWGPLCFIAGYAVAELLFVPGLPLTVLGGVAFGPLWGIVWVSAGSTLGAALAFLVARHAMRPTVERWVAGSPRLGRLDAAVQTHGWRILMVTRLVPLFPFNLQNFAYGLTRIGFWRFVGVSWVCMLPGTAAYVIAAGALAEGRGDTRRTVTLLAVAGLLLVGLSLLPRWLGHRDVSRLTGDGPGPSGPAQ